ncbi:MAG: hypothetical protein KKB30_00720 [Proteobacteria bacterium]|nr:hypothetical protein [Pseudomonadota bacterium]MBU1715335.1 hypothetical protein [Pseudomonadota bacterium]
MNPADLVPVADMIPVPWGWFQFFLILTFMLHLLLMNVMVGGGIIALFNHLRNPAQPSPLVRDLSRKFPTTIAIAVNFGVAPLLFLQVLYGHFMYVSSVLMAVYWLSVVGMLIVAYYSAYFYNMRFDALAEDAPKVLGLSVVLLMMIGFVFSNNMTLMLNPQKWTAYFDHAGGTMLNLCDPTLFPRYLHFMTASLAIGGLAIALLNLYRKKKGDPDADRLIKQGMSWFSFATAGQIVLGIIFLTVLPSEVRTLFLGGSVWHTSLLIFGISGAVLLLFFGFKKMVLSTTVLTGLIVLVMVLIRDLVRRAYLAPYFSTSDLQVASVTQYLLLLLFVVVLLLGFGVMFYVLKLGHEAFCQEGEVRP